MNDIALTSLGPERLVAIDGRIDGVDLSRWQVLRLAEQEWLVLDAAVADLPALPDALAIDVGDASEGWRLTGAASRTHLAKACPLDLDRLGVGAGTRTSMGGVTVTLQVVAADAYVLRVERSYAAWFEAWLLQL